MMEASARRVTVIPAAPEFVQKDIRKQRLRVAPYCRVSTDSEEQLNSYAAQIEYYTAKIAENPDWTMVKMYADEGITGTSICAFPVAATDTYTVILPDGYVGVYDCAEGTTFDKGTDYTFALSGNPGSTNYRYLMAYATFADGSICAAEIIPILDASQNVTGMYYKLDHRYITGDFTITIRDLNNILKETLFEGQGKEEDPYLIKNELDLLLLMAACTRSSSSKYASATAYIKLTDNIVFHKFTIGSANIEVKAVFEAIQPTTYTVTVSNDGNGTASASAASGTAGTEITLTATPSSGYQFKEWQVISGGVTVADNKFTIGSANVEVKAIFEAIKYTVTFNANGHGTDPTALNNVTYGSKITAPAAPTDEDWTFGGWYKEAACTNAWNFDTDTVTANTVLYAKWTLTKGDVNGDESVDMTDAQLLFNYLVGKTVSGFDAAQADVNGDSSVNSADIVPLLNLISKLA